MISQILGGLGLFLLGMLLLTDGLKAAAGEALKRILTRFTGRTTSAFFSGLTITAMVQSSSATTLATIGFVSAGLLTFSQAIGVIIGGSVGTTTTGWIVSLLGLKLSVGKIAMPLIGAGALMRLMLKGRIAALGLALGGFGLIFVGIEALQHGMDGLATHLQPESLPDATLLGRLILVLVGIVLTVIMQSSSAAVATTITAYHAGTLNLEQALALIIGASIGTTVTAGIAAIGASAPAKRTALVHVLFNSFSGFIGFALLPIYVWAIRHGGHEGAWSLALYHTAFHVAGAAVILPGVTRFSGLVTRLIPDRGPMLIRHLDDSLIQVPEVAIEALRRALADCGVALNTYLRNRIDPEYNGKNIPLNTVQDSLRQAYAFLSRIPASSSATGITTARLSLVHALDHLDQLTRELMHELPHAPDDPTGDLAAAEQKLRALLADVLLVLHDESTPEILTRIETIAQELAAIRKTVRHALLQKTAEAQLTPEAADGLLGMMRSIDTSAYHLWRAAEHLHRAAAPTQQVAAESVPA